MFIRIFQNSPLLSTQLYRKHSSRRVLLLFTKTLILSASLGGYIPTIQAADFSCVWKGKILHAGKWTDQSWGDCNNTFPNNTGSITYDATLRTGFSGVDLDQNIEIQNFSFNGGTFKGENELIVNEVFNWSRGNLMGAGIIEVLGGLDLNSGRKVMGKEQTLINSQTANWSGGSIDLFGTSELVNSHGATFNVTSDRLRMFGSSTSQFINEGNGSFNGNENGIIMIKLGDPTQNVQFDGPSFNNNGMVIVEQGIARLGGGGTSAGAFYAAEGQLLNFSGGTHVLLPGSSVLGSNIEFSHKDGGGTTTIEGVYDVENTVISGNSVFFNSAISYTSTLTQTLGFLEGIGNIVATDKMTLSGGWIQSSKPHIEGQQDQAILASLGELDINGSFIQIVGHRRVMNFGIANWTSGGIRLHSTLSRFENKEGAVFNIKENATFIVGAGLNIGADPLTPLEQGLFVNRGDIVVDLSDERQPVQINTRLANLGKIHLQGNKLVFGSDLLQFNNGSLLFDIGGENLNELDVLNIAGEAKLDGLIDITLTNSFVPRSGATFDILVAGSISPFETIEGFSLGGQDGDKFDFDIVPLDSENQVLRLTYR
ncbi:MAG: hypothetical protein L3J59_04445 [Methylococcaceae bacterium]|nr:hypothetical protein [Methylococcaceae bacterium]